MSPSKSDPIVPREQPTPDDDADAADDRGRMDWSQLAQENERPRTPRATANLDELRARLIEIQRQQELNEGTRDIHLEIEAQQNQDMYNFYHSQQQDSTRLTVPTTANTSSHSSYRQPSRNGNETGSSDHQPREQTRGLSHSHGPRPVSYERRRVGGDTGRYSPQRDHRMSNGIDSNSPSPDARDGVGVHDRRERHRRRRRRLSVHGSSGDGGVVKSGRSYSPQRDRKG